LGNAITGTGLARSREKENVEVSRDLGRPVRGGSNDRGQLRDRQGSRLPDRREVFFHLNAAEPDADWRGEIPAFVAEISRSSSVGSWRITSRSPGKGNPLILMTKTKRTIPRTSQVSAGHCQALVFGSSLDAAHDALDILGQFRRRSEMCFGTPSEIGHTVRPRQPEMGRELPQRRLAVPAAQPRSNSACHVAVMSPGQSLRVQRILSCHRRTHVGCVQPGQLSHFRSGRVSSDRAHTPARSSHEP
jgi:hypothetical protein